MQEDIISRLDRIEALLSRPPVEYVDNDAAASFLGLQPATLEIWRSRAEGPPYVKVGKRVMYAVADLREWMEGRKKRPLL